MDRVLDMVKNIIAILAVLGIAIDLTPAIKVNPYKWVFSKIRNALYKPMMDELTDLKKDVKELRYEQYEKDVRDMRGEILTFANSCHNKIHHTNDEFIHIIEQISVYETLIEKHNIKNGVIEEQAKYIKDLYRELLREGSLL